MLHAAAHLGHLHVGEFFVRVRSDVRSEELHRLPRRPFEGDDAVLAILREDPRLQGHAHRPEVPRRKLRHPDIVQPRRDRHTFLPMRHAPAAPQIDLLHQQPVGHHLISRRRRHQELAGRLIGGMVDHRQPLTRQRGPVPTEEGAVAELVLRDVQARARHAVIPNRELPPLARRRGCQWDGRAGRPCARTLPPHSPTSPG